MAWASPNLAAQAAYFEHLGTAPGAEVIERDGIFAVRTRVRSNGENGVVSEAGACVTRALAEELADWFGEWGVPASWLCEEGEARAEAGAALEAAGYRPERSAWEMRAHIAGLDLGAGDDAGLRIARVASDDDLERWLEVAGTCEWWETQQGRRDVKSLFAGLGFAPGAALRHYVATRDEQPVGMASAFYAGGDIVLAAVAVIPSARRRGTGRALALARLREARERGCELALLSPSADGDALYETLGFRSVPAPADRWFHAPLRTAAADAGV